MKAIISWTLRIVAAAILMQTLFFKFTAAPESVMIFEQLNMEPHGRILIGILELIAAILLIIPQSVAYGALLGAGLMSGALLGHITRLGFADDMFSLSLLALLVFLTCIAVLIIHREQIPLVRRMFQMKEETEEE